jgi:predicted nucleic acid-binding Zn finger protein
MIAHVLYLRYAGKYLLICRETGRIIFSTVSYGKLVWYVFISRERNMVVENLDYMCAENAA